MEKGERLLPRSRQAGAGPSGMKVREKPKRVLPAPQRAHTHPELLERAGTPQIRSGDERVAAAGQQPPSRVRTSSGLLGVAYCLGNFFDLSLAANSV
jgi:hypothetical protein